MADSFKSVVGQLLTYCPFVPLPLVEIWVRDRWRQLCESRKWSFLRGKGYLVVPDVYSVGTASIATGSSTVTGAGTSWTVSMVGRQIKLGATIPVYTIAAVASATSLTIEGVFLGTSISGATYQILQVYFTPPADFLSWLSVVNSKNWWRFHINYFTSEDIDRWDPQRTSTGMPYVVASAIYKDVVGSSALPLYEIWPWPVTNDMYPYLYWKRPPEFTDTYYIPSVVSGDVLVTGALADLAKWPGIEDRKNPMYSLSMVELYERKWLFQIGQCGRNDNEIYQTDLRYDHVPLYPFGAAYAQVHAMTEP
jgi:hypothetical protein